MQLRSWHNRHSGSRVAKQLFRIARSPSLRGCLPGSIDNLRLAGPSFQRHQQLYEASSNLQHINSQPPTWLYSQPQIKRSTEKTRLPSSCDSITAPTASILQASSPLSRHLLHYNSPLCKSIPGQHAPYPSSQRCSHRHCRASYHRRPSALA